VAQGIGPEFKPQYHKKGMFYINNYFSLTVNQVSKVFNNGYPSQALVAHACNPS
jgi:hypothetical protein